MRDERRVIRRSSRQPVCCLCVCLLIFIACLSCAKGDDVASIRTLIRNGVEAAEAHDVGGVFESAAEGLTVMPGNLDRREAKAALWRAFKYYGTLTIHHPKAQIRIQEEGQRAVAEFPFLILKRGQSYPGLGELPEDPLAWLKAVGTHADLYRLKLEMKRAGDWVVDRAVFERFTGLGFEG